MPRSPKPYQLTPAVLTASVGVGVLCLAAEGLGRTFRLHTERPGAHLNRRLAAPTADLPSGVAHIISPVAPKPSLIRVDISGPIEQRAGFHDPCGGWSDGNDAIAERLCAAFAEGDVLLVVDTPGGAAAGAQQGVAKALRAKQKHGRRVTGWANEMIGSLGMWWAMSLCDELFIPAMGQLGSIGARGEHTSIEGALAKEGVVKTYFADPPDKVAFAPEFALTPAGAARGNRDVKIAADAFRAAVCGGPIGLRTKLTPEALIALGADMLTGWSAVDAGLCDGVATEDEVTTYALKQAEASAATVKSSSAQARAPGVENMKTRAEEEKEARARAGGDDDAPPDPPEDLGIEPPSKCGACTTQNEENAKFCKGCGASMAVKMADPPADDEEAPPSSKPIPAPAARLPSTSTIAEALGLTESASLPAQKAAAIDMRQVFDHAAKLTGHRTAHGIVTGLSAISHDASTAGRLRAERNKARETANVTERADLCKRLVACGGEPRGRVYVDNVSDDGQRKSVSLTAQFAEMRLPTLRDLVADHEKAAAPRSPYEPDRAAAQDASKNTRADGADEKTKLERAKNDPIVRKLFNAPGNTHSLDAIAAQHVKTLAQIGGAQ